MSRSSLLNKLLQTKLRSLAFCVLWLVGVINLFGYYGSCNYKAVPREEMESVLHKELNPNLVLQGSKADCKYDFLRSTQSLDAEDVPRKFDNFSAAGIANGSYAPSGCKPLFSVALLVTYRQRQSQLDVFIPYMHDFLRRQNIHYKVYVIEQQDERSWNKGVLYNVGARAALADGYPCLLLHDVDLLPLDAAALYACAAQPRHLSAAVDRLRYVLPYSYLVGGVCAIRGAQYVQLDGMSNRFVGWGGEDDDLARRMQAQHLQILRFPPEVSRYTMLVHSHQPRNQQRGRLLAESGGGHSGAPHDGLANVHARALVLTRRHHRLFTLIGVQT